MVLGNEFYFVCVYFYGKGVGDIYIKAECNLLIQTFSIRDCWKYSATEISRTTSASSDTVTRVLSDYSFQETDWEVGFDVKFNGSNYGFGIAPTGRSTPYHHIMWGVSLSNFSFYVGKANGGETAYRFGTYSTNTYYSVRIVKNGTTLSLYVDDVLQGTYTALDYMSSDTFGFYWLEWQSGNTIYAKNIYAKALS